MDTNHSYPGTPQHQRLLHQIVTYYRDDPRILALTIFGSLARGTWDQYSDLDLDAVVRDDVPINVLMEVDSLCTTFATIGEQAIVIAPDRADAADVVLASLREFSIRYHPLHATSPNIVESVRLLSGRLSLEEIRAAGRANMQPPPVVLRDPVDTFVRLALAVNRELHRQHFWQAVALLEQMRAVVVELFTYWHGGGRAYTIFQAHAPRLLREKLGTTLPQPTLSSVQRAFLNLTDIVAHEYALLGLQHGLTGAQQMILEHLRQQQLSLVLYDTDS